MWTRKVSSHNMTIGFRNATPNFALRKQSPELGPAGNVAAVGAYSLGGRWNLNMHPAYR